MELSAKQAWREELVEAFDNSSAVFVSQFKGMTVAELSELRSKLRAVGASYSVVKNTLARKAVEDRDEKVISNLFKGQVGVIFAGEDLAAAAKALSDVAKANEKLVITGGYMDGEAIDEKAVKAVASLPSREELLGRIVGTVVAPHRNLLSVMQGVQRGLVTVIKKGIEKKEGAA